MRMSMDKEIGRCRKLLWIMILGPFLFLGCGEEEPEQTEMEAKWAEREASFQESVKEKKMVAMDFSNVGESSAPESKAEKTEEQILDEPLRNLTLGVMGPETGELSNFGKKTLNGVNLALDEVNKSGGINGQSVVLFQKDTHGSVQGAMHAAEAMIEKNVLAIIGSPTGEVTFSATKPLNDTRAIMFSAGTRRRIGDTGIYHFRNTQANAAAVTELVRYCFEEKGYKDFALFTSMVNDFSIELSAFFKSSVMLKGGTLSHDLFLWPETTTYITKEQSSIKAQIAKMKEGQIPDALIFTGDLEEGVKVLGALKEAGLSIPLIGGEDLVVDHFLAEAGKSGIGLIAFSGFHPDSSQAHIQKFVADYQGRYKEKPDRIAALAYDATMMVLQAAKNAPSLRSGHIRKEILKIRDFQGVTGVTSFTQTGEVTKLPVIFEVREKNGKPKFVAMTEYR